MEIVANTTLAILVPVVATSIWYRIFTYKPQKETSNLTHRRLPSESTMRRRRTAALLSAAQSGDVDYLRQYKTDVVDCNSRDSDGNTLFLLTCKSGCTGAVELLFSLRPSALWDTNSVGCNALHICCSEGHVRLVKLLLNEIFPICLPPGIKSDSSYVCVRLGYRKIAVPHNANRVAYMLMQQCDTDGYSPLHICALHGHVDIASLLLKDLMTHKDVLTYPLSTICNLQNTEGRTPIMLAHSVGHGSVAQCLSQA